MQLHQCKAIIRAGLAIRIHFCLNQDGAFRKRMRGLPQHALSVMSFRPSQLPVQAKNLAKNPLLPKRSRITSDSETSSTDPETTKNISLAISPLRKRNSSGENCNIHVNLWPECFIAGIKHPAQNRILTCTSRNSTLTASRNFSLHP